MNTFNASSVSDAFDNALDDCSGNCPISCTDTDFMTHDEYMKCVFFVTVPNHQPVDGKIGMDIENEDVDIPKTSLEKSMTENIFCDIDVNFEDERALPKRQEQPINLDIPDNKQVDFYMKTKRVS